MARDKKIGIIITGDAEGGLRAITETEAKLEGFGDKTAKVGATLERGFSGVSAAVAGVGAVLGGLATGAIASYVSSVVQATNETRRYAETLGVPIEQLSAMEYAVQSVGIESGRLGDILKDVAEKIGDAYLNNGGEAAEALDNLGLSARELASLNPADQLQAIAGALDSVQTRGEKIQILESLANDASLLLPLLEDNAAGLRDLQAEAERIGAIVTPEEAAVAQQAAANIREMEAQTAALGRTLAVELLPAINSVLEGFNSLSDSAIFTSIGDFFDDVKLAAEWFAAYNADQIGFWEWLTSGPDEARARLDELKKEMGFVAEQADVMTISITKSANALVDHGKKTKAAKDEAEKFNKALAALVDELDPAAAATRDYEASVALLDEAWARGLISGEEHERLIYLLANDYAAVAAGASAAAAAEEKAAAARAMAAEKAAAAAQREWQRASDAIEQSLTDALLRGFESGEGFGENFVNTMENLFKTMVLQPTISAIVNPIAGGVTDIVASVLGSDGLGILDIASGASTLSSAGNLFSGGFLSTGLSEFLFGAELAGPVTASAAAGGATSIGTAGGALGALDGGAASFLSAAAPWIAIAAFAVPLLSSLFGDDDERPWTKVESRLPGDVRGEYVAASGAEQGYKLNQDDETGGYGVERLYYETDFGELFFGVHNGPFGSQQQADQYAQSIMAAGQVEQAILDAFVPDIDALQDYARDLDFHTYLSDDDTRGNWQQSFDDVMSERFGLIFGYIDESLGEYWDAMDVAAHEAAIKAAELMQKWQAVQTLSDEISAIDLSGLDELIENAGGLDVLSQQYGAFTAAFKPAATDREIAADLVSALREGMADLNMIIPSTREGFYNLVSGLDLMTEAGRSTFSTLMDLAPGFDLLYTAIENTSEALARVDEAFAAASASVDATISKAQESIYLSGLDTGEQYDYYRSQAESLAENLKASTDIDQIQDLVSQITQLTSTGFGLLDEGQQDEVRDELLTYLDDINTIAQEQLAVANDEARAETQALLTDLSGLFANVAAQQSAAAGQMLAAAQQMQNAAARIPTTFTVSVRQTQSEVGYAA